MYLTELERHLKQRCLAAKLTPDQIPTTSANLQFHSQGLKGVKMSEYDGASTILKEAVINQMHRGEVKNTVMSDRLIIRLGEEWLAKASRNPLRRANYTSDRMRRMAKLLLVQEARSRKDTNGRFSVVCTNGRCCSTSNTNIVWH